MQSAYIFLGVMECGVLFLSVYLARYIRFTGEFDGTFYLGDIWFWRAVTFAGVMHCATFSMGVYQSQLREGFVGMATRSVVAYCLLGSALMILLSAFVGALYFDNVVLFIAVVLSVFLVAIVRWVVFTIVDIRSLRRRVLLFGAGRQARNLLEVIEKEGHPGVEIVGCVPSVDENEVEKSLRIAQPANWLRFVRENKISEIVVAPDERRSRDGGSVPIGPLLDCKLAGVAVTDAIKFCERETGAIELNLLNPSWMLFSEGFRYSQYRDVTKRLFDVIAALLLFAMIWPFALITALAVFLESGGPVLYSQMRRGQEGRAFKLYKFRSMCNGAEKDGKAVWAQVNDNRITKVGAFIRNTRLDELPQLYNVLKGDMSFVGPRPERPEIVCDLIKEIPYYDARHRVKPGLMGWAQLKYPYGASISDSREKLRYDLYYSKNHGLLLDILILIQTAEIILLGKGVR